MPVPRSILYLTESDVQRTLTVGEAVDLAERGIKADGVGQVSGDKFYMNVNNAGFIKPFSGYIAGDREKFDLPPTSSVVLLFDAETGLLACIMEANWVTGLKTAASTAVTTAYLARPESQVVTIFGAGTLGRLHMRSVAERFKLKQGYFVDILPEVAAKCAADLEPELGFPIAAVELEERESLVRKSDIIFTVTTGDQPLFEHSWLKPGSFIARLGSNQEVDYDVITQADKVIVDSWKYASPRIPEIIHLVESGEFKFDDVHAEWPSVVAGDSPGRESSKEIIVFMALGIWGEYAAILPEIFRKAVDRGLGRSLPPSD